MRTKQKSLVKPVIDYLKYLSRYGSPLFHSRVHTILSTYTTVGIYRCLQICNPRPPIAPNGRDPFDPSRRSHTTTMASVYRTSWCAALQPESRIDVQKKPKAPVLGICIYHQ